MNGLALGDDPISTHVYFSVDRLTLGKPGTAVATASATGNAAAAIFRALPGNQSNAIELSNTDLGLTGGFFGDELDALAARNLQRSPADLLRTDFTGGSSLFLPAAALGLFPADNVDALAVPESAVALTWAALGAAILGIHVSRRLRR